jgi:YegS/Rv2252/BmrU family lipid kinase
MVKPVFDSSGAELSIFKTAFPGHARELGRSLPLESFDGFLILGGDGTFHEVVNGMLERQDGLTLPIGLIPGGSGNSVLHDLGLLDPISAAKAIVSGQTRLIDVARIEMDQVVTYSINLIGWGLVTDVGKRAEGLRWLGPSRYTVSSIVEIVLRKNRRATLVLDDKTFIDDFTFVVACNSIHIGKGMKMAPYAKLDDGLIDILVVDANITRQRLFSVLPKLFDGTHVKEPEVAYHQVSSFSLFPETNDILIIDGEMGGTTPISARMLNHAIKIFV